MKIKKLPLAVFSSPLVASSWAFDYRVQEGDHLTKIAQRQSRKSPHLGYSQMLALILKLNGNKNLDEYNLLQAGRVIKLPGEEAEIAYLKGYREKYPPYWKPYTWKIDSRKKYVVKEGDSLSKLAKTLMPDLPIFGEEGSLALLLKQNPELTNPDKIFANQELALPEKSSEDPTRFIPLNKSINVDIPKPLDRYPASAEELKDTVDIEDNLLNPPPIRINKVPSLKDVDNKIHLIYYRNFNRQLIQAGRKIDKLKCLKEMLDFSRECGHEQFEDYYLKLISIFKKDDIFAEEIKHYLSANA